MPVHGTMFRPVSRASLIRNGTSRPSIIAVGSTTVRTPCDWTARAISRASAYSASSSCRCGHWKTVDSSRPRKCSWISVRPSSSASTGPVTVCTCGMERLLGRGAAMFAELLLLGRGGVAQALVRRDDVGDAQAELLVDHDDLALRDDLAVDEQVDRLAGEPVQGDDRARRERQRLADRHGGAADLDGQLDGDVDDAAEV